MIQNIIKILAFNVTLYVFIYNVFRLALEVKDKISCDPKLITQNFFSYEDIIKHAGILKCLEFSVVCSQKYNLFDFSGD